MSSFVLPAVLVPSGPLLAARKRPRSAAARRALHHSQPAPIVELEAERVSEPPVVRGDRSTPWARWALAGVLACTLFLHLWGIRHDLPYITDDPAFVSAAGRVATSASPNPRWFGHPGSTLIYPLAAIFRIWKVALYGGALLPPDPQLQALLDSSPAEFHLLGRVLGVVYALLSVLLVYRVGRIAFGEETAVIGSLLAALCPTEIFDKMVRTDSASLLFCLLALWCCLRLAAQPSAKNQILAGTAIGFAIGTKYYLAVLVGVLALVDGVLLWRQVTQGGNITAALLSALVGFVAVGCGFAVSTPYFFLDYATAAKDLQTELRSSHIGADGLSPPQNFLWYLRMLPQTISWPQTVAAVAGMTLGLARRGFYPLLLLAFAVAFLTGISLHPLHWSRWLIPLLPVVALFAAHGLHTAATFVANASPAPRVIKWGALVLGVGTLLWSPVERLIQLDRLHASPSTRVLARQWITEHLPTGSGIAFEWETLPPPIKADGLGLGHWIARDAGRDFKELSMSKLAVRGSIRWYAQQGFRYLVTSNLFYAYYPENAERYPKEAAFYRRLLAEGRLLYQVSPSADHEGPEIRVYEIH